MKDSADNTYSNLRSALDNLENYDAKEFAAKKKASKKAAKARAKKHKNDWRKSK